jgi:glycosyltransferase involved in cell wall biosynthesis
MSKVLLKSKQVDIMLVAEGTYPYVRGGVSSWIHQLMLGLKEFSFGIVFIGSNAKDYGELLYELPSNLKHLEVHYLFDEKKHMPKKRKGDKKSFQVIREFYKNINSSDFNLPKKMKDISFFTNNISLDDFLYSKESWEFMSDTYEKNCPDVPFIDYFWTLRNIHMPIWKISSIVKDLPKTKIIHSPSTGYAGFLAYLSSNSSDIPFILTEHGIYTRERKIDLLSAQWISYLAPTLLQDAPKEMNYIKKMWVSFFEKIGHLSYEKAEFVISLYPGARDIQVEYGAKREKTIVIPNGVDMIRFNKLIEKRDKKTPKIVTLIGRVVSIKDIKTFIRAIAIAKKSIPRIEGWIVGAMDEEKEYADECNLLVKSFDLEDNISFLGFQKIDDILPRCGLLTLTSISEGMPLVILEGFAAGLPCVSTDVGSCKDLIFGALDEEDIKIGKAGEVTTIANPADLAKNYVRFLNDDKLWKNAQKSALRRVEKYYQEDLFLQTYKNLYKRFI